MKITGVVFGFGVWVLSDIVQIWFMLSVLTSWVGNVVLALVIAYLGVWVPLPWFLFAHWYFEGSFPWVYIIAWVFRWAGLCTGAFFVNK